MPITVKGLPKDEELEHVPAELERIKWFLWHGNTYKVLEALRFLEMDLEMFENEDEVTAKLYKGSIFSKRWNLFWNLSNAYFIFTVFFRFRRRVAAIIGWLMVWQGGNRAAQMLAAILALIGVYLVNLTKGRDYDI